MSSSSNIKIPNLYEIIPNKFKNKKQTYENYDKMRIDLPARILLIGKSGSGKTAVASGLIPMFNCFNRIYLFGKQLDQPIYRWLIDWGDNLGKKLHTNILFYSEDPNEIPPPGELDRKFNNLVIFDDMITENKFIQSKISEYFTKGRHNSITVMYLSQDYFSVPKLVRRNLTHIIIKALASLTDLQRINREYSLGMDKNTLIKIYREATRSLTDFLLVDLNAPAELQYRKNFEPITFHLDP